MQLFEFEREAFDGLVPHRRDREDSGSTDWPRDAAARRQAFSSSSSFAAATGATAARAATWSSTIALRKFGTSTLRSGSQSFADCCRNAIDFGRSRPRLPPIAAFRAR